jgi:hypothetical protein
MMQDSELAGESIFRLALKALDVAIRSPESRHLAHCSATMSGAL